MSVRPTERWLNRVCAHVRGRRRRAAVRQELAAHLDDRMRALKTQGMDETQAEQQAVASMGDPDAVGRALAQADRPLRRVLSWLRTILFWVAILALLTFSALCLTHVI